MKRGKGPSREGGGVACDGEDCRPRDKRRVEVEVQWAARSGAAGERGRLTSVGREGLSHLGVARVSEGSNSAREEGVIAETPSFPEG